MRSRLVLACMVALSFVSSAGCKNPLSPVTTALYSITGTAKHVSVTYANSTGGTSQTGSSLPFTYTLTGMKAGDFLYVSAQIDTSPDSGSIDVSITKDGKTLCSGFAVGFAKIATASCSF